MLRVRLEVLMSAALFVACVSTPFDGAAAEASGQGRSDAAAPGNARTSHPAAAAAARRAQSGSSNSRNREQRELIRRAVRSVERDILDRTSTFVLGNGLRVVVHEDRRAPVVAVKVEYDVGARDEADGHRGFAHLFEHLMFSGSRSAPGEYAAYLRPLGATGINAGTSYERTSFYEMVPKSALERVLFLESDRMGHLGPITQATLDREIGVVLNEVARSDHAPSRLVRETLFPAGHPYRAGVSGLRTDIAAATLRSAREWHSRHYGPNNAVLVLAGDINVREARPLVERYFGAIPRGPRIDRIATSIPTLPQRIERRTVDAIPRTRLTRSWLVPGFLDRNVDKLQVGLMILSNWTGSKLEEQLVRGAGIAASVDTSYESSADIMRIDIVVEVTPGSDPDQVSRQMDDIISRYMQDGPTQEEIDRIVAPTMTEILGGREYLQSITASLATGMFNNDVGLLIRDSDAWLDFTPQDIRAAMQRWLSRSPLALRVDPGVLPSNAQVSVASRVAAPSSEEAAMSSSGSARTMPPVGEAGAIQVPEVSRSRLSNGIEVIHARRRSAPLTRVRFEFDAGRAADSCDRAGLGEMTLKLLLRGSSRQDGAAIAAQAQRLGTRIDAQVSTDTSALTFAALTPNVPATLDLLTDIVRNPAFPQQEIDQQKTAESARLLGEVQRPDIVASHVLLPAIYGAEHPYACAVSATADTIGAIEREDIRQFYETWYRPDNLRIYVMGDQSLAEILPQLEARLGNWRAADRDRGRKQLARATQRLAPRILIVDRPDVPQSTIMAGQMLDVTGRDDLLNLIAANRVLGSEFLSRLNTELRVQRGWTYGVRGNLDLREGPIPYLIRTAVQPDRTAESVIVLRQALSDFLTRRGTTVEERERVVGSFTGELSGRFLLSQSVLDAMAEDRLYHRPADYWAMLADRYSRLTARQIDDAARTVLRPDAFTWVIVGNRRILEPQFERAGLPVEIAVPSSIGLTLP